MFVGVFGYGSGMAANPSKIKVGILLPLTGTFAAVAETQKEGALLAVDVVNKKGGLAMPWGKVKVEGIVADDEAKHFLMLNGRMNDFDCAYGDLPAHDGLWESSIKTADDFAARLAVVPMVLEARGLDVTPHMIESMKKFDDDISADLLQIIHDDEITHVRAGTVWFESWCAYHNLDIEITWQDLVQKYFYKTLKPPFNHPSRSEAGLLRQWYEPLMEEEPRNAKKAAT